MMIITRTELLQESIPKKYLTVFPDLQGGEKLYIPVGFSFAIFDLSDASILAGYTFADPPFEVASGATLPANVIAWVSNNTRAVMQASNFTTETSKQHFSIMTMKDGVTQPADPEVIFEDDTE